MALPTQQMFNIFNLSFFLAGNSYSFPLLLLKYSHKLYRIHTVAYDIYSQFYVVFSNIVVIFFFDLKVTGNEKKGGVKVVSFDSSWFDELSCCY